MNPLEAYSKYPSKKKAKKLDKLIKQELKHKIAQGQQRVFYNRLFAQLNQE
jgi:hypothetical protein